MSEKIENVIIHNLEKFLNQKLNTDYSFSSSFYDSAIQINGIENKSDGANTMFIKVGINKNNEQVYISNIFVPFHLKHQNIGKEMISIIYLSSLDFGYDVFLVDLTDSFYESMFKRGAVECNETDILQITENTKLN